MPGHQGQPGNIGIAGHRDTVFRPLRRIKVGLTNGNLVEVQGNLKPGEQIVTKGSLFIDRAASGS